MEYQYARRMEHLRASEIRELLKVTENQEMISFAGGLPAPELFPLEGIKRASRLVLEESGREALQYSTTEGYGPLREWIARRMNCTMGSALDQDNIVITNGSQQALDLTGKVFLDEGDVVLCESPTYLSAIGAFRAYGCRFAEVPTDDGGMEIEALEKILERTPRAKLIYVIPNFQNPTGRCWNLERRMKLAELAARRNIVVVEDNPYGELRFEGEHLPSIQSFDRTGRVICLGTFSKILCPGYRVGWVAGAKEVIEKYVLVKQGTDLQCSTISQREISKYLDLYDIDAHIGTIRRAYRQRRDLAVETIAKAFPEGVAYTRPQGGLFLWVTMPEEINARQLLESCVKQGVTFVPGGSFFPNHPRENTMRINFSNMKEERIQRGLELLGDQMARMM